MHLLNKVVEIKEKNLMNREVDEGYDNNDSSE